MEIANCKEFDFLIEKKFDTLIEEEKKFNLMNDIQYRNQIYSIKLSDVDDFRLDNISDYNKYAIKNLTNLIDLYSEIEELLIYGCNKSINDKSWSNNGYISNIKNYVRLFSSHNVTMDLLSKTIIRMYNDTLKEQQKRGNIKTNNEINELLLSLNSKMTLIRNLMQNLYFMINIDKTEKKEEEQKETYVDNKVNELDEKINKNHKKRRKSIFHKKH